MKKILSLILSFTMAMLCFIVNIPHSYADTQAMLSIADVTGEAGETVDVEIEISNNPGIIAISFDVEYDSSKLKLVKAEDEKLLGTSTSVFGKDLSANPYRLCWDDLSDSNNEQNGVLATLTFEILEDAAGEAEISLIFNQGSTFNIDFEDVEFAVSRGKVNIGTQSETPATDAMLSIADVSGEAGDTVDVEVEVSNNPGIIAISFDVEYDSSKLKLVKAEDEKLLGTSTSVFGNDLSANPYRLCWDDLSDKNNEQNGVLATLTFEILEDATGAADINLILNQGSTFNIDFEDVEFAVSGGKVNIGTVTTTTTTTKTTTTTTTTTTTITTTAPTTTVTTTTTPPTTELTYLLGDVNADGSVDSSDASRVLAEYAKIQTGGAGEFTDIQYKAADVNKDGVVDSSDASKILAYYAMVSTGKNPTWD